jgi:hypothetical protein
VVDAVALRKKVSTARVFVKEYESKKLRFDAMLQASKESTSNTEKATILLWLNSVSKWLEDHKEEHERASLLIKIPESDLAQLEACDKALYGP